MARKKRSKTGRSATGRIKKGYRLTKGGHVVKAAAKRKKRSKK